MRFVVFAALVITSLTARAKFTADAIYDGDDRQEIANVRDPAVLRSADATVSMFLTKNLTRNGDSFEIDTRPMSVAMKICADQRFADQPSAAECTGVLIGPDRILTAGHCISKKTCPDSVFAFGYAVDVKGGYPDRIAVSETYTCKSILARSNTESFDFAVVELDRAVPDHVPARLAASSVDVGDEIYLLSHPAGTPLKYSPPQPVLKSNRLTFKAEIDALGGSSGGPVFSKRSGEVVGILVAGGEDYVKDKKMKCRRLIHCKSGGGCIGEISTQSSAIVDEIP